MGWVWITSGSSENEIRASGEDQVVEFGFRSGRRWELGDEIVEKIERCDRAQSPIENGHDPELHSLHRFGIEHELGLKHLEVQ